MLTEDMRILAGLQNSRIVEDPMKKFIEDERKKRIADKKRINERKDIISNFDLFKECIEKYNSIISDIYKLLEKENSRVFLNGLTESKFNMLHIFSNIVINEDMNASFTYLENNYTEIKKELDTVIMLTESVDMDNCKTYFVSNTIITHDLSHNIKIPLFKDKLLSEKISNEIPYGAEIIYLNENISIIRYSGKKFYTKLNNKELSILEEKGFII